MEIAKFPRKYDIFLDRPIHRRTDTNRDLTLHSSEQKTGSSELWRIFMTSRIVCCLATLGSNKAAIMPYFNYCSLVWHFCKGSDKNKLERTNERGLRAVFCDWGSFREVRLPKSWKNADIIGNGLYTFRCSEAFDLIDHHLLIQKILSMISSIAYNLLIFLC